MVDLKFVDMLGSWQHCSIPVDILDEGTFEEGCRAFVVDAVTAEQAGFEWARENELVEACLCSGAGPRFQAGCEAYVVGFGG